MKIISLDKILCGQSAEIESIAATEPDKERLNDIGLTKGSVIKPLFTSPSTDPTAYEIKGALIAIRKNQAKNINVLTCRCDNHEKQ